MRESVKKTNHGGKGRHQSQPPGQEEVKEDEHDLRKDREKNHRKEHSHRGLVTLAQLQAHLGQEKQECRNPPTEAQG